MDPRTPAPWETFMSGVFVGFIVGAVYAMLVVIIAEYLK